MRYFAIKIHAGCSSLVINCGAQQLAEYCLNLNPPKTKRPGGNSSRRALVAVVRREGLPDDHDDRGRFSARQTPKPETAVRFQAAMDDLAAVGRRIVLLSGLRCP